MDSWLLARNIIVEGHRGAKMHSSWGPRTRAGEQCQRGSAEGPDLDPKVCDPPRHTQKGAITTPGADPP